MSRVQESDALPTEQPRCLWASLILCQHLEILNNILIGVLHFKFALEPTNYAARPILEYLLQVVWVLPSFYILNVVGANNLPLISLVQTEGNLWNHVQRASSMPGIDDEILDFKPEPKAVNGMRLLGGLRRQTVTVLKDSSTFLLFRDEVPILLESTWACDCFNQQRVV